MTAQILLAVDKPRLSVAPGASVELAVSVQNLTTLVDEVAVYLEGIEASWVQVIPAHLPVFAQGQASVRVIIQPPSDPARSVAGVYPLRVRGTSQENPGQEGEASAQLEVQLVGDYKLVLGKGESSGGQEASYPLKVQNGANAPLRVNLGGRDADDALWYKFDPFQVGVPAGGEASALLSVRAKHAGPEPRAVVMNLTAQGNYALQGGAQAPAPSRQITGEFIQPALAPLSISVRPAEVTGATQGTYEIGLSNPGLLAVTVQLAVADSGDALDWQFQPAQLMLPAQSEGRATLVVRARAQSAPGERKASVFRVRALPTEGSEARSTEASATFVQQTPAPISVPAQRFPWWILVIGVLVLILLAVILLTPYRP